MWLHNLHVQKILSYTKYERLNVPTIQKSGISYNFFFNRLLWRESTLDRLANTSIITSLCIPFPAPFDNKFPGVPFSLGLPRLLDLAIQYREPMRYYYYVSMKSRFFLWSKLLCKMQRWGSKKFSSDPDPAPYPTLIRNEKNIYIHILDSKV